MPKINKKNFILWLCSRKDSPLRFSDNLLYSYLAWRPGGSLRQIAADTGLDRCKSVAPAITRLREVGLVAENEHSSLPPPEGWFMPRKSTDTDWRKQFLYFPIAIRQNELTAKQNALFAAIKWRPLKRLSWYAACLKLNRSGVYSTLAELRKRKFVSVDGLAVRPDAKDIWKDIDNATFVTEALKSRFPSQYEPVIAWVLSELWCKVDEGSEYLLNHKKWYNRKYVSGYWQRVAEMLPRPEQLEVFIWEFANLLGYVLTNAKSGGYLTTTTQIVCEQIVRMWQQKPPGSIFMWSFQPTTFLKC
jgi:hypothetical protein